MRRRILTRLPLLCVALVASVTASGCLASRVITSAMQAGDKNVTLVQTADLYSFAFFFPVRVVHQFWKCSETPGMVSCKKTCDTKGSDLTCPAGIPASGTTVQSSVK